MHDPNIIVWVLVESVITDSAEPFFEKGAQNAVRATGKIILLLVDEHIGTDRFVVR